MERDNRKLDDEIAYMKEQFRKIDKETPLPASLSGAFLLQKMKEQEASVQPKEKKDYVIFWSKRMIPLAACFAIVLGIFLGYNRIAAPINDLTANQEAMPEGVSLMMDASDGMDEGSEEAVLMEEESVEEAAPALADESISLFQESDREAAGEKVSSFSSYEQAEQQLLQSKPNMGEERMVKASPRIDDRHLEQAGTAFQNAVLASVSDEKRQVSVIQGEEDLELYVLGSEKDAKPKIEAIDSIDEVQNLYLQDDILTVIGNDYTEAIPLTHAIQYEISADNVPQKTGSYSQTGENVASGYYYDTLYLVSSYSAIGEDGKVHFPEYSPIGTENRVKVEANAVFYKEEVPSDTFTVISAIADISGSYEYNVEACLGQVELMIDDRLLYDAVPDEPPQFLVDVYETEISFE